MKYTDTTVFLTGQATPSKDDAITTIYQIFSLSLLVETKTDCIVNLVCTTAMEETQEFLRQIICGRNLVTDMDVMVEELKKRFLALMQKTFIVALKDAQNKYLMTFPEKRIN